MSEGHGKKKAKIIMSPERVRYCEEFLVKWRMQKEM
jgi:hypothetical protein